MTDQTPEGTFQREDEDDHDLLTYGEARVRLQEAVVAQRELVDRLRGAGSEGLSAAVRRLESLEAAAQRNARQPINDENFEHFFGYSGTAKRNT